MDEAREVDGAAVVACCEATDVLEAVEAALDPVVVFVDVMGMRILRLRFEICVGSCTTSPLMKHLDSRMVVPMRLMPVERKEGAGVSMRAKYGGDFG